MNPKVEINAAARRAVFINEIPDKYKKLPILGRGATSIILDAGLDVIVLTRDSIKREWLTDPFGLSLGEDIEELEVRGHKNTKISDLTLFILKMPKLNKLSVANKKKLRVQLKQFFEIWDEERSNQYRQYMSRKIRKADIEAYTADLTKLRLEELYPDNIFIDFLRWAVNYDDWMIDLHSANFAENAKGEIVLLDPVVSKSLYDTLYPQQVSPY